MKVRVKEGSLLINGDEDRSKRGADFMAIAGDFQLCEIGLDNAITCDTELTDDQKKKLKMLSPSPFGRAWFRVSVDFRKKSCDFEEINCKGEPRKAGFEIEFELPGVDSVTITVNDGGCFFVNAFSGEYLVVYMKRNGFLDTREVSFGPYTLADLCEAIVVEALDHDIDFKEFWK